MKRMFFTREIVLTMLIIVLTSFILIPQAASNPPKTQDVDEIKTQIFNAEKEQNWNEAIKLGNNIDENQSQELKRHIDRIRSFVEHFKVSKLYSQSGDYADALAVLKRHLEELDKKQDPLLVLACQNEMQKIEDILYHDIRKDAEEKVKQGENSLKSGKYDEAILFFEHVIKNENPGISKELKYRAELKKQEADLAKKIPASFFSEIWNTLKKEIRTILVLLFYFALIMVLISIILWLRGRFWFRTGIDIEFEDHTVAENERKEKDLQLSLDFVNLVRKIVVSRSGEMESYKLMNLGSVYFPNVTSSTEMIAFFATQIDSTPVKLGPFSITPKQLFTYIFLLFKPRYESTLYGVLSKEDNRLVLRVETKSRRVSVGKKSRRKSLAQVNFEAVEIKTDFPVRDSVLLGAASQFLVSIAKGVIITEDWRSLKNFLEAEELLSQACADSVEYEKSLPAAQKKLTTSLRYDPSNWMARYKIAIVLGKMGKDREACEQFEYIEKMLKSKPLWESLHFKELLKSRPDFLWIAWYNQAICRSRRKGKLSEKGREYLEELKRDAEEILNNGRNADLKANSKLKYSPVYKQVIINSEQAKKILILTRGALAAARCNLLEDLAERIDNQPFLPGNSILEDEMKKVFEEIVNDEQWLYEYVKKIAKGEWQVYPQAHAAAQNAVGRANFLMKNYEDAKKFLEWAIGYQMPANFSYPYINLAEVYIKCKDKLDSSWGTLAGNLLKNVLDGSPDNKKANYLMGVLLAQPEVKRYDEALTFLDKTDKNAHCLYQEAEILIEHKDDKIEEGLQLLLRIVDIAESDRKNYYGEVVSASYSIVDKLKTEKPELLKSLPDLHSRLEELNKKYLAKEACETSILSDNNPPLPA